MKEKSPAAEWRRGRNGLGELERLMKLRGRVNPDFVAALRADFRAHGAEAVAQARATRPLSYLKLAAVFLDEVDPDEAATRRAARDAAVEAMRAAAANPPALAGAGGGGATAREGGGGSLPATSQGPLATSQCPLPGPPPQAGEGEEGGSSPQAGEGECR
jgi:hypothetical protein